MNKTISPHVFYTVIKTKEEALLFNKSVEELLAILFTSQKSVKEMLELLPQEKATLLLSIAQNEKVSIDNKMHVQELLRAIQETIDAMKVVHLILAIDPQVKTIQAIHKWFYRVAGQPVLLEIDVDPSLIAGGIISFNGRLQDYTLKRELAEMIETLN